MRDDYTGVPHTCPKIDEVISFINSLVEWDGEETHTLQELVDLMEAIRDANGKLRDFGNEKAKEVEELENELYNKRREIDSLTDEMGDLNDTIGELEDELAEVKYG